MSNTWKSPLVGSYGTECSIGVNDGCECAQKFLDHDAEYQAVRHSVALADSCHYGKFRVSGSDALDCVNKIAMADISRLAIGRATWTFMLHEDGSILCDAYIACMGDEYLVLTEGSTPAEALACLSAAAADGSARVEDLTTSSALIGVDGPYSWELLKELIGVRILGLRYLEFLENQSVGGANACVMRAGKTGEFGYLIMLPVEQAEKAWSHLMEAGKAFDVSPAGFETLNLCRLENRFINIHREGHASRNPFELNCRVMVDREKDSYNGSEALQAALESPLANRIIGVAIDGGSDAVPELGASLSIGDRVLGTLVNVGFSPTLGKPIALALMAAETAYVGIDFDVEMASGHVAARTVSAPFIFNKSMTVRPQEDSYRNR